MAREILKQSYNTYEEISEVLESIDFTWNNLKTLDRFRFCKHPYNIFYINPLSPNIETIRGPYKVFDLHGNTITTNKTNDYFRADNSLFKFGPLIVYLKTDKHLYMLFISKNAVTEPFIAPEIVVNRPQLSSITINNTTDNSIYYSYTSEPVEPPSLIEIKSGMIEIIQPTSVEYLYIRTNQTPISINTNNTRTKLVNNYFLLVCPTNFSKAQTAKLTGNPINTIKDELDIYITI